MKSWWFLLLGVAALRGSAAAEVRVLHDVAYLASDRSEKLDVYLPARTAAAPTPAVVWIHGGGWKSGTKAEKRAAEFCRTVVSAGYVAVSIDYRLGESAWPTCLLDARNAVRFLRVHAADYGIDPSRIAVAGGSAGGHLALMVAFATADRSLAPSSPYPDVRDDVRCVIDLYGPTDLADRSSVAADGKRTATQRLVAGSLAEFDAKAVDAPVFRVASPLYRVTRESPPVLIAHGTADPTVDFQQSEKLAKALQEHGIPHQFVVLDQIGHTFDLESWGKQPLPTDLRPVVLKFLETHLGPPAK